MQRNTIGEELRPDLSADWFANSLIANLTFTYYNYVYMLININKNIIITSIISIFKPNIEKVFDKLFCMIIRFFSARSNTSILKIKQAVENAWSGLWHKKSYF
jgi:hypothetical protein